MSIYFPRYFLHFRRRHETHSLLEHGFTQRSGQCFVMFVDFHLQNVTLFCVHRELNTSSTPRCSLYRVYSTWKSPRNGSEGRSAAWRSCAVLSWPSSPTVISSQSFCQLSARVIAPLSLICRTEQASGQLHSGLVDARGHLCTLGGGRQVRTQRPRPGFLLHAHLQGCGGVADRPSPVETRSRHQFRSFCSRQEN